LRLTSLDHSGIAQLSYLTLRNKVTWDSSDQVGQSYLDGADETLVWFETPLQDSLWMMWVSNDTICFWRVTKNFHSTQVSTLNLVIHVRSPDNSLSILL